MKEFDIIYDTYFKDIYRFILSLTRNTAVAEDIVQDTFIKALNNIHNLRDDTKIKSWLFQIAKNTYLTHVSKSVKTISTNELEIASTRNEISEFADQDTARHARKILHKMPEPHKEIFYLRVFANLSFKEIAEIFDQKEDWARQTYHRAKLIIKEQLQ